MFSEADRLHVLQSDPWMMRGLGAGFVRDGAWDTLHGCDRLTPLWPVKNQARMHRRKVDRPYGWASWTLEPDDRIAP